jgi:uncharacterized protein (TIGR00661 family)
MARIVYALSGQGRGHTSRVLAISDALRQRGHEVRFCCGGTARAILEQEGEPVIPVPALRQVMDGNALCLFKTIATNLKHIRAMPHILDRLAEAFRVFQADLLITDFEMFSSRAARRIGLPVLSFNHQEVVTETEYDLPRAFRPAAWLAITTIKLIVPRRPHHVLLSSFFFPPLKHPDRTTLVPPIIRPAVQAVTPRRGTHVLVYYNETHGGDYVLECLRKADAHFIVYNFGQPAHASAYPNLTFKEPSLEGFLEDLATSRAVLCTAGFTLISEALYLGKPLLVVPNRGIFEQTLNALFLKREGLGDAVIGRCLTTQDVQHFLSRLDTYEKRLRDRPACGNADAVACIEQVLQEIGASVHTTSAPVVAAVIS